MRCGVSLCLLVWLRSKSWTLLLLGAGFGVPLFWAATKSMRTRKTSDANIARFTYIFVTRSGVATTVLRDAQKGKKQRIPSKKAYGII